MPRNIFHDPAGVRPDYPWTRNHNKEDTFGKRRNIEQSAPTLGAGATGVGLVKQQSDEDPLVFKLGGRIVTEEQHQQFVQWYALCGLQTIYYYNYAGDNYEVIITAYEPTRVPVAKNPADPSIPFHVYDYSLEMEVITVWSGPWTAVTP